MALRNAHGKKGGEKATADEEQAKTLSLLLLKEKGTMVKEGRADRGRQNGRARISLSFPFNVDETCPEPMRRALLDGTALDQTGRGLAVAHHYRTINHYHTTGMGIEAPPLVGGPPRFPKLAP